MALHSEGDSFGEVYDEADSLEEDRLFQQALDEELLVAKWDVVVV